MRRNPNNVFLRILKKILILLLIVGIPAFIFFSAFKIKKIDIVGEERYTEDQLKELIFQSIPDYNSLYLYLKYRFLEQPKLPFVEKIEVSMTDAHSVTIYVYEKTIAGGVEFMGEYLYFDKDGIVVESSSDKLENVPIIKGLKFNEIVLNEKLNVQKDRYQTDASGGSTEDTKTEDKKTANAEEKEEQNNEVQNEKLFDIIINLTQMINKYELEVDTVRFSNSYEVTIDIGDITVLLGKKDTYDETLAELSNILPEVKGRKIEIDMRNYVKGSKNIIAKEKKSTE